MDSDCDVINALCPKPTITYEIFLMSFDNEINTTDKYNQTYLSELQSTGIPAIRHKLLGTDFSQRISLIPLIWKPCCPTLTREFRNGYAISIEKYTKLDCANCYLVVYLITMEG